MIYWLLFRSHTGCGLSQREECGSKGTFSKVGGPANPWGWRHGFIDRLYNRSALVQLVPVDANIQRLNNSHLYFFSISKVSTLTLSYKQLYHWAGEKWQYQSKQEVQWWQLIPLPFCIHMASWEQATVTLQKPNGGCRRTGESFMTEVSVFLNCKVTIANSALSASA